MKKISLLLAAAVLTLYLSCEPEPDTDYQAYIMAAPEKAVLVVNGHSESLSAYDPAEGGVYNHIQLLGHSGTNRAIPADLIIYGDRFHVILSGQNSIESYDKLSLDYIDEGKHYFKNGYNPMTFIPVPGKSWIFAPGFETDEIQAVNLSSPGTDYSFHKCYAPVSLPGDAHSEIKAAAVLKNAAGDNKKRGSTGGAVLSNGSDSRLYLTNVRYDSSILMTEADGSLSQYPADSGRYVKAPGNFREATMSIFRFNADAMTSGASDASLAVELVKEIDLEALYSSAAGTDGYFQGNGLNPQSAFILEGRLNIICTGTNGGTARSYTSGEYIPPGYSSGDEKPGTDPDDGLILVFDISDPDNPVYMKHLNIGGSPAGFRESVDSIRQILYLAGVGGIQSYRYGSSSGDYSVLHSSSNMILTAARPELDYYSGLCFDSADSRLFVSFYTEDSLKTINVSGSAASPVYSEGGTVLVGDGPGAISILER